MGCRGRFFWHFTFRFRAILQWALLLRCWLQEAVSLRGHIEQAAVFQGHAYLRYGRDRCGAYGTDSS